MSKRIVTLLTLEGWIYLLVLIFLLIGALARQINLLVAMYGVLGGPLILSWGLARKTLRGLVVRRHMPPRVAAGEIVQIGVEIANGRTRLGSWTLLTQDRLQRAGHPALRVALLHSYIPAGQKRQASYRARLPARGAYRLGPLRVSTRFPFGLLRASTVVDCFNELLVTPRLGQLTPAWRRRLASIESGVGTGSRRRGALEGDFYGLREWRTDDSQRWIHWRTSARRQSLVVRQFEQPQRQEAALVVELWQPENATPEQRDSVELAVSFAATTFSELAREGAAHLSLDVVGSATSSLSGGSSSALVDEAFESLARAEPSSADRLDATLAGLAERLPASTLVVVVSSRPLGLSDPNRYPACRRTAAGAEWLSRIVTIDASHDSLGDYFVLLERGKGTA